MALRAAAVDAIFAKLSLIYGTRFASSYGGQDMATVRDNWARELTGLDDDRIKHALSVLPAEFPPTVLQFRLLSRSMPAPYKPLPPVEAPRASPEAVQRAQDTMKTLHLQGQGGVQWARLVLDRAHTGDGPRPTRTAIEMAERALRSRGLLGSPGDEVVE